MLFAHSTPGLEVAAQSQAASLEPAQVLSNEADAGDSGRIGSRCGLRAKILDASAETAKFHEVADQPPLKGLRIHLGVKLDREGTADAKRLASGDCGRCEQFDVGGRINSVAVPLQDRHPRDVAQRNTFRALTLVPQTRFITANG